MKNKCLPEISEQKIRRFIRIYPWFVGLSMDLLFWIAIDTLFLQFIKGLQPSDIALADSLSYVFCIILQFPVLKLTEHLEKTHSVRIGIFVMCMSSILLTLGHGLIVIVLGLTLYQISFFFKPMQNIILKNNLELLGCEDEYINISIKANTIYAVSTTIIALIASPLFNLNSYLPMGLAYHSLSYAVSFRFGSLIIHTIVKPN